MKENFKKEIENVYNNIIKEYGFNNSYAIDIIGYNYQRKFLEINTLLYEMLIFNRIDKQEIAEYIREQYERL